MPRVSIAIASSSLSSLQRFRLKVPS